MIVTVPFSLSSPQVSYTPNSGFIGLDTFSFSVSNGVVSNAAVANINVRFLNCRDDAAGCNNGR